MMISFFFLHHHLAFLTEINYVNHFNMFIYLMNDNTLVMHS